MKIVIGILLLSRVLGAVNDWTPTDVATWLTQLNPAYDKYAASFLKERISGNVLTHLSAKMLEENLGVDNALHRTVILTAVAHADKTQAQAAGSHRRSLFAVSGAPKGQCVWESIQGINKRLSTIETSVNKCSCSGGGSNTGQGNPTSHPTRNPTRRPTSQPTLKPTVSPTVSPTEAPTIQPTIPPSRQPTPAPTTRPTREPTLSPTRGPTRSPTSGPSQSPTVSPTQRPTQDPTVSPTQSPTVSPTISPTVSPTPNPTRSPTVSPTSLPTRGPTVSPTSPPTVNPTVSPTSSPTVNPTVSPTVNPTVEPSLTPTMGPTPGPTMLPTAGCPWRLVFSNTYGKPLNQKIPASLLAMKVSLMKAAGINGVEATYKLNSQYSNLADVLATAWKSTGYQSDKYKPLSEAGSAPQNTLYVFDDDNIGSGCNGVSCTGWQTNYAGTPHGLFSFGLNSAVHSWGSNGYANCGSCCLGNNTNTDWCYGKDSPVILKLWIKC